jgi:hypothetical protein
MAISTYGTVALIVRFAGGHSHLITFGYCGFAPHYCLMAGTIYFIEVTETGD